MGTIILLILFTLILLAIWAIRINNTIISNYNGVERAWASVLTQERQKNKIIPYVEQLVEDYKLHETSLFTEITKLRTSIDQLSDAQVDTELLEEAEKQTSNFLSGLRVTVEAYPELKASDAYLKLMDEISEQQEQVGAALRIFNQNVESFNTSIQVFPNSLVNKWVNNKQAITVFYDSEASAGFEYKPNF
ncbi:hypothetical protein BZG72_11205 [Salinivibrio sp. PR6]|uniref:LemA family protein n=1 Tax=Salinivibrio sp. PR6 TaxID=1909485 RepID=UPI000989913A|nr:LemA family protein [Salinivibrio sp. PR6]OOE81426.1 hypothetical protein BZG72_11205 [Salinivibrio sp. PR6]